MVISMSRNDQIQNLESNVKNFIAKNAQKILLKSKAVFSMARNFLRPYEVF